MPNKNWGGRNRRPKSPKLSREEMEARMKAAVDAFKPATKPPFDPTDGSNLYEPAGGESLWEQMVEAEIEAISKANE